MFTQELHRIHKIRVGKSLQAAAGALAEVPNLGLAAGVKVGFTKRKMGGGSSSMKPAGFDQEKKGQIDEP